MAITRVTQRMLGERSQTSVRNDLGPTAKEQEQLGTDSSGNRPSDPPSGTDTALRGLGSLAEQQQYLRNVEDGKAWLRTVDTALSGIASQVGRAHVLALQGIDTGSMSQTALEALATEVEQIRASALQQANTQHLGRPVFGGTTVGGTAFDTVTGGYVGDDGAVERRVGADVEVRVDSEGKATFGEDGNNLFTHLEDLAEALRHGSSAGVEAGVAAMGSDRARLGAATASTGARCDRITEAGDLAFRSHAALRSSVSGVGEGDVAEVTMSLQTQQIAHRAALVERSGTVQRSLLDFLR